MKESLDHFHDAFIRHGIYPIRHDTLADANDIILVSKHRYLDGMTNFIF